MPRYRVMERSYIGHQLRDEGDIVEYDGKAGPNLQLIDPLDHDGDGRKGGSKAGRKSGKAAPAATEDDDGSDLA